MSNIINWGKQIYDIDKPRELHRMVIFILRAYLHHPAMQKLERFFLASPLRREIIKENKFPLEQATRAFFYKDSTFRERVELIENHFSILEEKLKPETVRELYAYKPYTIWQSDEDMSWQARLQYSDGQRKEGLLSVTMVLKNDELYQMIFWLNKDKSKELSLFIGAMQGPKIPNARDVVKEMTKKSFRYRTKNLILYMTQAVARSLGIKHIYAVTNRGYYAMNHMRKDRKLKTDFAEFWGEVGGKPTRDYRFFELPMEELRKTMEEVPTHKRAVYRKRFAFLDGVDRKIAANMAKIKLDREVR